MVRRKSKIDWNRIKWGSLTRWLKAHEKEIRRRYGKSPFTRKGTINDKLLRSLYRDERFLKRLAGSHYKRIKRKIHFKLRVLNR